MVKKTSRSRKQAKSQLVDAEFEKRLRRRKKAGAEDEGAEPVDEMSEQEIKTERLAEALRENLHKRKEQARSREENNKDGGDQT